MLAVQINPPDSRGGVLKKGKDDLVPVRQEQKVVGKWHPRAAQNSGRQANGSGIVRDAIRLLHLQLRPWLQVFGDGFVEIRTNDIESGRVSAADLHVVTR